MRLVWWLCWCATRVAVAAPIVVFENDETPQDGRCERVTVRVGGGAAMGYRPLPREAVARLANVAEDGAAATTSEAPFGGAGDALRLAVLADDAGWWSVELPVPPTPALTRHAAAGARLVLAVRGGAGGERIDVGLTDASRPRHTVRLPLARYGRIETTWTLFRVPLADFAAQDPELALDQLAAVEVFSVTPGRLRLDLDHVQIAPDEPPSAPVRVVYGPEPLRPPAAPPTAPPRAERPTVAPRSGAGAAAAASPAAAGAAGERTAPVDQAPAAQPPLLPPSVTVGAPPAGPTPGPAEPVERPAPAPTPPAPTPAPPVERPAPTPAPTVPRTPAPAPVVGPKPDSPVGPKPPAGSAEPERPMLPVSFFFTDAGLDATAWPQSRLRATWATNQGERGFDPAEMKEYFAVIDGEKLPLVDDDTGTRAGKVLLLQAKQAGYAWWVARIGRATDESADERPYLRNGRLELTLRGAAGGEVIRIGLVDDQNETQVALVRSDAFGEITTTWQPLRIPLRALKVANPDLDWSRIKAVVLASANGQPLTVHLDDLRIVNPVSGGP